MAMIAEDPDQLALGDVPTALGPFFPGLPSGLQVDLRLQGDRIRTVEHVRNRFPVREVGPDRLADVGAVSATLAPAIRAALGEPVPLQTLEWARIRAHIDWAARLLDLAGLEAVARRFTAAAAAPGVDQRHIERLFARAERWGLRRLTQGVGRISREQAEHLHLVGPLARASGIRRDARLADPAYREAGFDCIVGTAGDIWERWRLRRRECLQSFDLIAAAGEVTTIAAEAPNGELRRRGGGRLAGASAASLAAVKAGLPGLEWLEGVLFLASLGLDMGEAALR
jgi:hypothetical protein